MCVYNNSTGKAVRFLELQPIQLNGLVSREWETFSKNMVNNMGRMIPKIVLWSPNTSCADASTCTYTHTHTSTHVSHMHTQTYKHSQKRENQWVNEWMNEFISWLISTIGNLVFQTEAQWFLFSIAWVCHILKCCNNL